MSTSRTALTGITRIHLYYRRLILLCFVNQLLLNKINNEKVYSEWKKAHAEQMINN